MIEELLQATARIEDSRTLRGYWLLVPREHVDRLRTEADERGWTGLIVTASPYVPENTGYLIKEAA